MWERCARGHLQLDLALEGADAEELDEATRDLQRELSELDVEVASGRRGRAARRARARSRSPRSARWCSSSARSAVAPVARVLQGWLARRSGRTIKLTSGADSIEISGGSAAYQQQMIETFLSGARGVSSPWPAATR